MLDYGYGDFYEREEAERQDEESERAAELLKASAVRFCPTCGVDVLTRARTKTCLWCDGTTKFPPNSLAPACSTTALGAAGAGEDNNEERAA